MTSPHKMQCPSVYARGKRCTGHLIGVQGYGRQHEGYMEIKKVRFWCSDMNDHSGAIKSTVSKVRMEFYPDEIPIDLRDYVERELIKEFGFVVGLPSTIDVQPMNAEPDLSALDVEPDISSLAVDPSGLQALSAELDSLTMVDLVAFFEELENL